MAAARDDRPSLVKMLLTWRATVFSLMNSSAAIARLVLPAATRRSTSTSRAVSPPAALAAAFRDERLHPGKVGRGAELLEHPARRVELHLRRVLVPELPAGEPDQHPGARGFVRRLELLPGRPRPAQRGERGSRVTLGEENGARGVSGHRVQERRVELAAISDSSSAAARAARMSPAASMIST